MKYQLVFGIFHLHFDGGKPQTSQTLKQLFGYLRYFFLIYFIVFFLIFSYLFFFSKPFTNHRTEGEGVGNFLNSSLPLPPASQTLRHQSDDYRRGFNPAHRQQPDSNRKPLLSKRKSLTTKLRALICMFVISNVSIIKRRKGYIEIYSSVDDIMVTFFIDRQFASAVFQKTSI